MKQYTKTVGLSGYTFTSHYLKAGIHQLHYVDEGEGNVVLMVHGNPTWSYYYRNLIRDLSREYRVIALDNMGCGLSDKPQDYSYTLKNHIANLTLLIRSLKIRKFSLIVHDWGGPIGIGAALKNITMLQHLVVLNSAAFRSKKIPLRIRICKIPVIGEIIVRLFNGFAWPATFMAVEKKLSREVKEGFLFPYNNWKNRIANYQFVKDIPLRKSHRSYEMLKEIEKGLDKIERLKVPLLVCWGGKDFCFHDDFFHEWRTRFPEADYHYIENGGHYILEDEFEEVKNKITDFFHEYKEHFSK